MKKYLIITSVEREDKELVLLDVKYAGSPGEMNKIVKTYSKATTVAHRVFEIDEESTVQEAICLIEVASKMLRQSETERVKK